MALTESDINVRLSREFGIDPIVWVKDHALRKELIVEAATSLVRLRREGATNAELEALWRTLQIRVVSTYPNIFYPDPDRREGGTL